LYEQEALRLVDEIISEVILSNQQQPSIPSIVLEATMDIITSDGCDTGSLTREPSMSQDIEGVLAGLVEGVVDEVILSNSRQPSVCGIVLDVIMFFINNPMVRFFHVVYLVYRVYRVYREP